MADETPKKDDAKPAGSTAAAAKKAAVPSSKAKTVAPAKSKPDTLKAKASAASEPKDQTTSKTPQKRGSSRFAWLLVFLLVFFIGGVAATPYVLPQALSYMPAKVKAYFQPLATTGGGTDLADVTGKLTQLEDGLKDVRQLATSAQDAPAVSGGADASAVAALSTRLDDLTSQLEQLSQAQASQTDAYARLQTSLNEIPAGDGAGVSAAVVANLKAQLEESVSARQGLAGTVEALSADVMALSETSATASNSAVGAEALSALETALGERIMQLEEQLKRVSQAANSAAAPEALENVTTEMTTSLGDFEARLTALENVRQQATAAMVAGLETARLAQAISNGRAYAAELTALTQLKAQAGPALPDINDLLGEIAPFAETGIPSGAALSAALEERSREILTAIDTPDGANWWQELVARIRNLIVVRKVGEDLDGTDPKDILARAEVAARDGNWDAVVSEINTLPDTAKDSFGRWWAQANARATAQRALADLSARLGVAAADSARPAQ